MWACTAPVLITGQLATHPSPGTLRRMTLLGRRSMSSQDTCGITVPESAGDSHGTCPEILTIIQHNRDAGSGFHHSLAHDAGDIPHPASHQEGHPSGGWKAGHHCAGLPACPR